MRSQSDAVRAIERGLSFLAVRQLPSGEIPVLTSRDPLMRGDCTPDPSVFPTALAASLLARTPGAAAIRERAVDFLCGEMDHRGLWRHWPREHPHAHDLPPDLDDTAVASCALRLASRPMPDNRPLVIRNRDRRGMFFTWIAPRLQWRNSRAALERLRHPLTLASFFRATSAKPSDVDAVVNANVVDYLGDCEATRPAIAEMIDVLRRNGETSCDKWYERPFAVWFFFARALHDKAPEACDIIAERIAAATPLHALDHALAAAALLNCGHVPDITPLLDQQLPSGGWPRAGLYHGGRARIRGGGFAAPHPDTPWWGSEELTAAFAVGALSQWIEAVQR